MNDDKKMFERIEKYIIGKMTGEERQSFEDDLKKDEVLAQKYALQLLEHESMEKLVANETKGKFATWNSNPPENPFQKNENELQDERQKQNMFNKKWLIVVFVIGILTLLYFWINNAQSSVKTENIQSPEVIDSLKNNLDNSTENKQLEFADESIKEDKNIQKIPQFKLPKESENGGLVYVDIARDAYVLPQDLYSELKSGGEFSETSYSKALTALKNRNYKKGLSLLGPSKSTDDSKIKYLRGHLHYNNQNFKAASIEFEAIASDELLPNYDDGRWFYFLSIVAQLPKSKSTFDSIYQQLILDKNFDYKSELEQITNKINYSIK